MRPLRRGGPVHDAFVHIRSLFKGTSKEIFVIDGCVDYSLFQVLLSTNSPLNLQNIDEIAAGAGRFRG
jgi:hypothetical protein